jgi:hypothetical protein
VPLDADQGRTFILPADYAHRDDIIRMTLRCFAVRRMPADRCLVPRCTPGGVHSPCARVVD